MRNQAGLRDALAATDPGCATRCLEPTREGLDALVAPLTYRLLFGAERLDRPLCQRLLARVLRPDGQEKRSSRNTNARTVASPGI